MFESNAMKNFLFLMTLVFCISCSPSEDEWVELFNGEDLEGWHSYNAGDSFNGWYVDNGVLVFDPASRTEARSSNLMSNKQYTNFEISFDWMISDHGNSGFFWGVVEDKELEHPYLTGAEIQILDDGWTEYVQERGDINRAGSLYNLMPPSSIVSKPAGEWNSYLLHIDHSSNEGFLIFNDVEVLRFPVNGPEWDEMIAHSGFADWDGFGKSQTGYICFQDNGSKVAFRNIMLRELP